MYYIIDQVTIDVKKKEFTVSGNGFPTQTKAFEDEDEWGSIQNHKGEHVLDYNIWWDEQWGFQYSEPEQLEDGRWQTGSDYKNPEKMIFVGGDDSPFYDDETLTNLRPMNNIDYAEKRINLLKGEMGKIQRVFRSGDGLNVEFENGMCLRLHDEEIKSQAIEHLEDALRQVNHG